MIVTDWHNLYNGKWKGSIDEGAFSHPAKYSQKLIQKVYSHALEEGWIYPGATVLDPFAGVGLGALYAMLSGVNWIGVEIEPRFFQLVNKNIDLWKQKYRSMNLGNASVILGDSRYVLAGNIDLALSSPPYAETRISHDGIEQAGHNDAYGEADGQMGQMKAGDFELAVSSPPYSGISYSGGEEWMIKNNKGLTAGKRFIDNYGNTTGQVGHMKGGDFELAISSPPYGDISQSGGEKGLKERGIGLTGGERCFSEYGETDGQLGRMKMKDDDIETFWGASKIIITNVYNSLKPGGHAIWVVKDYIKARQLIPFCEQWRILCESCGFKTVHMHKAWMVRSMGTQIDMNGEHIEQKKEYKSFFRKLNETKRGLPPIDWEVVWCMEK